MHQWCAYDECPILEIYKYSVFHSVNVKLEQITIQITNFTTKTTLIINSIVFAVLL